MPRLRTLAPPPSAARHAVVVGLLALLAGCLSADEQRADADQEVYTLLAERRAAFVSDPGRFTIDPDTTSLAARYASGELSAGEPLPDFGLVEALTLAAAQDTTVMSRKERLYQRALDLTLQHFLFRNRRTAGADAFVEGQGLEATGAGGGLDASLARILGTGGEVLTNVSLSVFRGLLSSDDWDPISNIGLSITQPLMRGFGRRIAFEPLTQAERTLLYEVRSYERFRRTFAFDVANDYLRILQTYDSLRNARANYAGLVQVRERNEALASAGRLSDIQVDQARQNELAAQSNLINVEQSLQGQLDGFKDVLGLPIQLALDLDQSLLDEIRSAGVEDLRLDSERAIRIALENRHDYANAVDAVTDAERKAYIAADALRSRVDLAFNANASSDPGQPFDFSGSNLDWTLGLDLDLPVDNIVERNAYRNALITLQQARRAANDLEQVIRISVRDSLRELDARRQDWEIQRNSVVLAERRVESTTLNFEAGRAQTRDLLEAQAALLAARNALTRSLIDYRLALYAFFRDLELLTVDQDGLGIDLSVLDADDETQA